GIGRDLLRRHAQVALVLALLIVHHDDHVAAASFFDGFLDRNERGLGPGARIYFTKHAIRLYSATTPILRNSRTPAKQPRRYAPGPWGGFGLPTARHPARLSLSRSLGEAR